MVRSLSASVGVPPVVLTVTFPLMVSVSVTVLPAPRSPLEGDSVIELIVGACGCADLRRRSEVARDRLEVAQRIGHQGPQSLPIDRCHRQRRGILPGRHRVAEGQRIGAGAAGIGRGAAVVERQRRRAADRHRLAHIERQGERVAAAVTARSRRS